MAEARHPRRRQPTALIRGSVALNAGAAAALLLRPHWWPWLVSLVAADHLLLTAAGLVPKSRLLGPNWSRLPAAGPTVALTIDDGPDPDVTPRTLALLAAHGARATFFCVGERVVRHPSVARQIVEHGHTLGNHSHRHLHRFSLLGPRALAHEIGRAQDAIANVTGTLPRFFRAPAGLRNPFLEPVLARASLQLVSWTRRGFDTVSGDPQRILARLTRGLRARDILLLHDGHAARTSTGLPVILEVLPPLLAVLSMAGLTPVTLSAALGGTPAEPPRCTAPGADS